MDQHFFKTAFADSGDTAVIPEATQPDGSVSYEQGWGPDYQLDPATDPSAKLIPRDKSNGLMKNVTAAIQQYQIFGTPEFITSANNGGSPYSYSKGARVRYDAGGGTWSVWVSLVDANTATPGTDATKWQLAGANAIQAQQGNWATDTGAANTYVLTPAPAIASYTDGLIFRFVPANANTGASTLAVSGLAGKAIVMPNGRALVSGDIPTGGLIEVCYSSATDKFVLLSVNPAYVQQQPGNYVVDTSVVANQIVATLSPAISAHVVGMPIRVKLANNTTNGGVTFNPNGIGAKNVRALGGLGYVSMLAGYIYTLVYDGTQYQAMEIPRGIGQSWLSPAVNNGGGSTQIVPTTAGSFIIAYDYGGGNAFCDLVNYRQFQSVGVAASTSSGSPGSRSYAGNGGSGASLYLSLSGAPGNIPAGGLQIWQFA